MELFDRFEYVLRWFDVVVDCCESIHVGGVNRFDFAVSFYFADCLGNPRQPVIQLLHTVM
jgi:hypothetical protein